MNEFVNMKFRKPRTEAQLTNIREVRTGLLHKPHKKHVWKTGHSEATKRKISEALKGHKTSDEIKNFQLQEEESHCRSKQSRKFLKLRK